MFRLICVSALLLIAVIPALGEPDGYLDRNGYTYKALDGYWYKDSVPYSVVRVWVEPVTYWDSYAYCYKTKAGYYNSTYTKVEQNISYKDPLYRVKLLEIAANRDKEVLAERRDAFAHAFFLQEVEALGLKGNFALKGYGHEPPFPQVNSGTPFLGSYGVNGTTLYGVSTVAQVYSDNGLQTLYQALARNMDTNQAMTGDMFRGTADLARIEGDNHAKIARLVAFRELFGTIMDKLEQGGRFETKTFSIKTEDGKTKQLDPKTVLSLPSKDEWAALVKRNDCTACHSGTAKDGGFDVWSYNSMDLAGKQRVVNRLLTHDEDKLMPRNTKDKTKPGKRMSPEDIFKFSAGGG